MKKNVLWLMSVLLVACGSKDDTAGSFVIRGKITNNSGKTVYLAMIPIASEKAMIIDSAKIGSDGNYKLTADTTESAIYTLRIGESSYPFASVINDAKSITLNANFPKGESQYPEKYEVEGSDASLRMRNFMYAFNNNVQEIFNSDQLLDTLKQKGAKDEELQRVAARRMEIANNVKLITDTSLANAKSNPALAMFILGYYQQTANVPQFGLSGFTTDDVKLLVDELVKKFPEHKRLAAAANELAAGMPGNGKWVGKTCPDFELPDPSGKVINIKSFRGKYVLVDFWASWCGPCRNENPNVVKAYNKFKDKNFTILGVSLDQEKDAWVKAIMQDKLTWTHISDLAYWSSSVVPLFGFGEEGIPYNILLDPNGKVIAERLTGQALEKKLEEVLK